MEIIHPLNIIENDIARICQEGNYPGILLHIIPDSVSRKTHYNLESKLVFGSGLFFPVDGDCILNGGERKISNRYLLRLHCVDSPSNQYGGWVELHYDGVFKSYETRYLFKLEEKWIFGADLIDKISQSMSDYLRLLGQASISPPFWISLSFLNIGGYTFKSASNFPPRNPNQNQENTVRLPAIRINSYSEGTLATKKLLESIRYEFL